MLTTEAEEQGVFLQQAVIYEREPVAERHLHEILNYRSIGILREGSKIWAATEKS